MPERDVVKTITDFAPLWDELFPAEQARIVRLLVERVDLSPDGMQVRLRAEGLQTLVEELRSQGGEGGMKAKRKAAGENWEFDGNEDHRPHPDDVETAKHRDRTTSLPVNRRSWAYRFSNLFVRSPSQSVRVRGAGLGGRGHQQRIAGSPRTYRSVVWRPRRLRPCGFTARRGTAGLARPR